MSGKDDDEPKRPVTLLLDRSALLAYPYSIHVGEPVGEVIKDGDRYGVTDVTVAETLELVTDPKQRQHLYQLLRRDSCAVLPTKGDWRELSYWRGATGRIDLATTVMASLDNGGAAILSGEGNRYGEHLPVIHMPK
ncbi:hypothetical protein AB0873_32215 [Micromonospora sp. NPDC047707]|uniref:hypothetical protein n=1 Tax=Micromonospora sp. NPDC047707 TaxID=3154498 RepID=UPI00345499EA